MFRETYTTVSWLAFCRLERYRGSFATVSAFDLKHLSFGQEKPLYYPYAKALEAVVSLILILRLRTSFQLSLF